MVEEAGNKLDVPLDKNAILIQRDLRNIFFKKDFVIAVCNVGGEHVHPRVCVKVRGKYCGIVSLSRFTYCSTFFFLLLLQFKHPNKNS